MTPGLILPQLIACDEAGFTGNRMLDAEQPYFAYASVDYGLTEAEALIAGLRARHRLQMGELKASKLLRTPRGRAIVADVLARMEGRYIVTLYDKRLSLACKFFEYIYEPVLQRNNRLFYDHNLHRFVGMFLYMLMVASGEGAEDLALEFERFMRTLDPTQAPSLFGSEGGPETQMLDPIMRFARGYNVVIARETRDLKLTGDTGKWVLDLTIAAVTSHLRAWAERHPLLDVVCDDSKPLRALASVYDGMVNRPDPAVMEFQGKRRQLTWNMAGPITYAASDQHAAVQLADIAAGAMAAVGKAQGDPELRPIAEKVMAHMNEDCILPDFDILDLDGDEAAVNQFVLFELADRADRGDDPLAGMPLVYEVAKQSLPEFRRLAQGQRESISHD